MIIVHRIIATRETEKLFKIVNLKIIFRLKKSEYSFAKYKQT
jgi:hypothetical protein